MAAIWRPAVKNDMRTYLGGQLKGFRRFTLVYTGLHMEGRKTGKALRYIGTPLSSSRPITNCGGCPREFPTPFSGGYLMQFFFCVNIAKAAKIDVRRIGQMQWTMRHVIARTRTEHSKIGWRRKGQRLVSEGSKLKRGFDSVVGHLVVGGIDDVRPKSGDLMAALTADFQTPRANNVEHVIESFLLPRQCLARGPADFHDREGPALISHGHLVALSSFCSASYAGGCPHGPNPQTHSQAPHGGTPAATGRSILNPASVRRYRRAAQDDVRWVRAGPARISVRRGFRDNINAWNHAVREHNPRLHRICAVVDLDAEPDALPVSAAAQALKLGLVVDGFRAGRQRRCGDAFPVAFDASAPASMNGYTGHGNRSRTRRTTDEKLRGGVDWLTEVIHRFSKSASGLRSRYADMEWSVEKIAEFEDAIAPGKETCAFSSAVCPLGRQYKNVAEPVIGRRVGLADDEGSVISHPSKTATVPHAGLHDVVKGGGTVYEHPMRCMRHELAEASCPDVRIRAFDTPAQAFVATQIRCMDCLKNGPLGKVLKCKQCEFWVHAGNAQLAPRDLFLISPQLFAVVGPESVASWVRQNEGKAESLF
ncbi:hypothetical protein C8J57DRAFT_1666361 [Mycena rebaudengoi]|nr:hypothetical protein C8J57DRAFT_1666361 [Mycena rebaudengoi]